jgi:hypothetical protein
MGSATAKSAKRVRFLKEFICPSSNILSEAEKSGKIGQQRRLFFLRVPDTTPNHSAE